MAQTVRTDRLMHRICQDYEGDLSNLNIPIHDFMGACWGILNLSITNTTVLAQINPPLSAQEEIDWNDLLGRMTAKANTANTNLRERTLQWWETVLMWYEIGGKPSFSTPEQVWNWLITS